MKETIAVLGAGNGGYAFSLHLTLKGFTVHLYEAPEFSSTIDAILSNGGIEAFGEVSGFSKIHRVTTNLEEALDGAQLIILPIPAFAQEHMFTPLVPLLKEGQTVLLCPDNTGSIRLYRMLKEKGLEDKVIVAGTSSLLYVATRDGLCPGQISIGGIKKEMHLSTMPAGNIEKMANIVKEVIPGYKVKGDALSTSLSNLNHQLHPAPMILNAGRIENQEEFGFYREGHTESIHQVIMAIDEEKRRVGEAMGLDITSLKDVFTSYYKGRCFKTENLHEMIRSNICYREVMAPTTLKSRFLEEDLQYGLVLFSSMGREFQAPTPIMDSIIALASVMNQKDYFKEGMTLEKLGLKGMDLKAIATYLKEG